MFAHLVCFVVYLCLLSAGGRVQLPQGAGAGAAVDVPGIHHVRVHDREHHDAPQGHPVGAGRERADRAVPPHGETHCLFSAEALPLAGASRGLPSGATNLVAENRVLSSAVMFLVASQSINGTDSHTHGEKQTN